MREGWEYKKLGEVATSELGKTLNQSKDEGVLRPYVCAVNVLWDKVDTTILKMAKFEDAEIERYQVSQGDLLICEGGETGRCAIWNSPEHVLYQNALHRVRLNNEVDARFAVYYFRFLKNNGTIDLKYSKGVTIKHLVKSALLSIPIPLPPLSVQHSIVCELDKLSELIDIKKKQLADYDDLAKSLFNEMFGDPIENEMGWEVVPLKNNVNEMFLGPFGSSLKVDSYVPQEESFCMVYEQKHAIKGTINLDNHFISKDKFESLTRFSVKAGDFIMSCRGTIGKLYRLPKDAPLGIIHPSLMKIRIKENVYNPIFFQFMLVEIVANEHTNGNCVQMAITAKALGEKKLIVPHMKLQEAFATRVETIREQMVSVENSKRELQELLASRMQYWFE